MAPIFEEASIAVDHNLLTMETLHTVAHRNGFKVLFHEKPFAGINGSGKHGNWSLSTDSGENLLDPTLKPETNYRFILFLLATLDAVHKHGGILRCGIASASNEHRLGGNEAPPGIISAFLGEHLDEVLNSLEEKRDIKNFSQPTLSSVRVGGTVLDLKITTLPPITRDLTDRNRTSPFAFTGNKFEFRAIGSKQSPSFPITILNAAVASSLAEITDALVKQKGKISKVNLIFSIFCEIGSKPDLNVEDILVVIRHYVKKTKPIRFEGNNYSEEWAIEAVKRGLPNIKNAPDAFKQLLEPHNAAVLTKQGIVSESELKSRYHIMNEMYSKQIIIEAKTMLNIVSTSIIPAVCEQRKELLDALVALKGIGMNEKDAPEYKMLNKINAKLVSLQKSTEELDEAIVKVVHVADEIAQAELSSKLLTSKMEIVRGFSDELEQLISDKFWPIPKYSEMLF